MVEYKGRVNAYSQEVLRKESQIKELQGRIETQEEELEAERQVRVLFIIFSFLLVNFHFIFLFILFLYIQCRNLKDRKVSYSIILSGPYQG